jgi:hypothetical protein
MFIDTLKFKTQLLEGGFEESQAQALVEALTQASTGHLATKTDIQELRTEIESVRGEIIQSRAEGRTEIEKFRGDTQTSMENLRGQMSNIKWMITALLIVNFGILGKLLFT